MKIKVCYEIHDVETKEIEVDNKFLPLLNEDVCNTPEYRALADKFFDSLDSDDYDLVREDIIWIEDEKGRKIYAD
jgi:hypothetical protein